MECPQHKVVSLTGNIAPDGSAAYYNVVFTMADRVKSRSFPMPLPVIASSAEERALLHQQTMIASTLDLAAQADVTFVGIGELDAEAPLYLDGFISQAELKALQKAGAVGRSSAGPMTEGRMVEGITNDRWPRPRYRRARTRWSSQWRWARARCPASCRGQSPAVNGLITDERTAEALLADRFALAARFSPT